MTTGNAQWATDTAIKRAVLTGMACAIYRHRQNNDYAVRLQNAAPPDSLWWQCVAICQPPTRG